MQPICAKWKEKIIVQLKGINHQNITMAKGKKGFAFTFGRECGLIVDRKGEIKYEVCGKLTMNSVAYSNGLFGFVNSDGNVYLLNEETGELRKVEVGYHHSMSIGMNSDGFLACYYRCAFFTFDGKRKWDLAEDIVIPSGRPSFTKGFWFVANAVPGKILMIDGENGELIESIPYEEIKEVATCGNKVAAFAPKRIGVYEIDENQRLGEKTIVEVKGSGSFDFIKGGTIVSNGCSIVAIAMLNGLRVFRLPSKEDRLLVENEILAIDSLENEISVLTLGRNRTPKYVMESVILLTPVAKFNLAGEKNAD